MKFGVREICNVVFKAKSEVQIGKSTFKPGQPVLYIDTAKTSTLEGAATTVYATGGIGNTNLIAWEGEKTLTFTVEDALLSPIGFSILSGAGLIQNEGEEVHVHVTSNALADATGKIDLKDVLAAEEEIDTTAPIFVMVAEKDGSITGELVEVTVADDKKSLTAKEVETYKGKNIFVDFYVVKDSAKVSEIQIDAENFAGYYYVEASTLFRTQADGVDLPAELTIPNVKIQSNFTFSMASTGDPSTFTFTMDAFPGYTIFNPTKKVLCVIQVIDEGSAKNRDMSSVMKHTEDELFDEAQDDSESLKKNSLTSIKAAVNEELTKLSNQNHDKLSISFSGTNVNVTFKDTVDKTGKLKEITGTGMINSLSAILEDENTKSITINGTTITKGTPMNLIKVNLITALGLTVESSIEDVIAKSPVTVTINTEDGKVNYKINIK